MSNSSQVLLIHRFLIACRRWASGSLDRTLQLLRWLNRWVRSRRSIEGILNDKQDAIRGGSEAPSSRLQDSVDSEYKAISSGVDERGVVLSCSSMPIAPPQVHTHECIRSMDSLSARSPTLLDNPSFVQEATCKVKRRYSDCSYLYEESRLHGLMTVEPEHVGAKSLVFKPTLPSERPRYNRGIVIPDNKGPWVFAPLETLAASETEYVGRMMQECSPWQYRVHPEGQPYYNVKDGSYRFSYVTEANVVNLTVRAKLEQFIETIEKKANVFESSNQIPRNVEVFLEVYDELEWSYYMADLDRRCVFWLDNVDLGRSLGRFGVESKEHFQYVVAWEFWQHVEHFPISHRQPMEGLIDEVFQIYNYLNIDSVTSIDSTAPYGQAELRSLMNSVKDFRMLKDWSSSSCAIVGLARAMSILSNERIFNLYGFHGARLSVAQSVRGRDPGQRSRSMLVRCLSPILFYAPANYLWRLERLYIDGVLRDRMWQAFHDKLESDLSGILLLSTVILVANVALLGPQNVLPRDSPTLLSTPAAATSHLSSIASIGGIIIGLHLKMREIRVNAKGIIQPMTHAINYLASSGREQLNIEILAIHFSLPYAMLMWSVVTFSATIAIMCFDVVNGTPNLALRIVYAAFWLFIVTLVFWSALIGWEFTTFSRWSDLLVFKPKWWMKLYAERGTPQDEVKEGEMVPRMDLSFVEKAGAY